MNCRADTDRAGESQFRQVVKKNCEVRSLRFRTHLKNSRGAEGTIREGPWRKTKEQERMSCALRDRDIVSGGVPMFPCISQAVAFADYPLEGQPALI